MNKRVILYVGQMNVLELFTLRLSEGLKKAGADVFIFDLEKNNVSELGEFCNSKVDAVITFNTMLYNMQLQDGSNAWEQMGIPFFTILVDHPCNFANTIEKFSSKDMVLCIDRNHMDYIGRFFKNIGRYGFLPHGGSLAKGYLNSEYANRKLDIVYAGGIPITDITHIKIPEEIIKKYKDIFDFEEFTIDIFKGLINLNCETVESMIEKYVSVKFGIIEDDILKILVEDFHFLHNYILTYYRLKVLEKAAETGAQLYIYGVGYEKFDFTKKQNVHLRGYISPEEVLDVMNDAKIVLTTMAWFKDGSHERIFNGMLARSVVISENTPYLSETFNTDGEKQELIVFDLNNLNTIKDSINRVLGDEKVASQIAENGYNKAIESHTWESRGIELYENI